MVKKKIPSGFHIPGKHTELTGRSKDLADFLFDENVLRYAIQRGTKGIELINAWDTNLEEYVVIKIANEKEVETHRQLRDRENENIVEVRDIFFDKSYDRHYIVMEECETDLREYLKGKKNEGSLPESTISTIIWGVSNGLQDVHDTLQKGHFDIKPENIGIKDGEAKLLDFGLSQQLEKSMSTGHGTRGYMSPEALQYGHPTAQTDIFTVGILLYELLTLKNLFSKNPQFNTEIMEGLENVIKINPSAAKVIEKACEIEPQARYKTVTYLNNSSNLYVKQLCGVDRFFKNPIAPICL